MSQTTTTPYNNLATQVYDLYWPTAPHSQYHFYRSYVQEAQGLILEPMCGSGRILIPLMEEGFAIQGFDASHYMLSALHTKAKERHLTPRVWQERVELLHTSDRYALMFIPSGSFGHIIDPDVAYKALEALYTHLTPGGKLVFEVETIHKPHHPYGSWQGSVWHKKENELLMLSYLPLSRQNNIKSFIFKYELVEKGRIIDTEVEEYKIRVYEPRELLPALKKVGFSHIRMVKAFERNATPDENNDEYIVYECTK